MKAEIQIGSETTLQLIPENANEIYAINAFLANHGKDKIINRLSVYIAAKEEGDEGG